jgi:hypothetical protein
LRAAILSSVPLSVQEKTKCRQGNIMFAIQLLCQSTLQLNFRVALSGAPKFVSTNEGGLKIILKHNGCKTLEEVIRKYSAFKDVARPEFPFSKFGFF